MSQCIAATNSSALALAPICTGDTQNIMTYEAQLKRWVVVLLLPNLQRVDVARFCKCSDAEGHAQILRRMNPNQTYEVMFDPWDAKN